MAHSVCPESCTSPLARTIPSLPFCPLHPSSLSPLSCPPLHPSLCPPTVSSYLFSSSLCTPVCTNASGTGCSHTALVAGGMCTVGPPGHTPCRGRLASQQLRAGMCRLGRGQPKAFPGRCGAGSGGSMRPAVCAARDPFCLHLHFLSPQNLTGQTNRCRAGQGARERGGAPETQRLTAAVG